MEEGAEGFVHGAARQGDYAMKKILAWHFTGNKLRDGRAIPKAGRVLVFDGNPIICEQGLHASREPFDALQFAPGHMLHMVECWGEVQEQSDKLVCTHRKIIKSMDATDLLWYFSRMQAVSVVHLWDAPDVVLDYLMTGDKSLRYAARAAARDAARKDFNALVYESFGVKK